jgi:hypothetical protein
MLIRPRPMRSRLLQRDGAIHARIPSHRSISSAFLGGLLVAAWLSSLVFLAAAYLKPPRSPYGNDGPSWAIQISFLLVWLAAGCAWAYLWLWNLIGREEVTIDGQVIAVRRWPLGRRREYDVRHVRRLRASPSARSSFRDPSGFFGGALAFDYGARTVRLGNGIDEAEAQLIVESIRTRFPELEL